MNLREMLAGSDARSPIPSIEVAGLEYDSRKIEPGAVFFAFEGANVDGHVFVPAAFEAGAAAVVSERPAAPDTPGPWVQVPPGRRALARAAMRFYDHPDRRLSLVGVTGTNGKTTTVYLIDSIFRAAGFTSGRFGTIEHRVGDQAVDAVNTTPESLDLVRFLVQLERLGGRHAALESSSHSLELGRVYGFQFDTAVFTNLSRDHLDFHGGMAAYERAKRRLFEGEGANPPRVGVINADDPAGRRFLAMEGFDKASYAIDHSARYVAKHVEADFEGLRFEVTGPEGAIVIRSPLLGYFNVRNILAAVAAGFAQGIEPRVIAAGIENCAAVPGRFETIREGQPFLAVVDYAHTDDALKNLIESARKLLPDGGRIITVFGCGGDRDRAKRPLMGEAAGRASDRVILTSDNPRTEDPLRILADAEVGLQHVDANYAREPDRRRAIGKALEEAAAGDIVLIAGKGHETYQQIGREKFPFDDRATVRELLHDLRGGRRAG